MSQCFQCANPPILLVILDPKFAHPTFALNSTIQRVISWHPWAIHSRFSHFNTVSRSSPNMWHTHLSSNRPQQLIPFHLGVFLNHTPYPVLSSEVGWTRARLYHLCSAPCRDSTTAGADRESWCFMAIVQPFDDSEWLDHRQKNDSMGHQKVQYVLELVLLTLWTISLINVKGHVYGSFCAFCVDQYGKHVGNTIPYMICLQ